MTLSMKVPSRKGPYKDNSIIKLAFSRNDISQVLICLGVVRKVEFRNDDSKSVNLVVDINITPPTTTLAIPGISKKKDVFS